MKNTDLNLDALENADNGTVSRIAESYTALDKKQRDRIFKISQKKYSEKLSESINEEHFEGAETSGVEIYSKPKWHRFLAAASSVIVAAGAITGGVYLMKGMKNPPDDVYSAPESESAPEPESSQTAIAELGAPFGDISEDKILFTTAAVVPYLIDVPREAQLKIAEAFNNSVWEEIDINEPLPPGETTIMYVYNNGEPFNLVFYGDFSVIVSDGINEKRYRIPPEVKSPITEAVRSDDIYDDLIWCDVEDVSVTGVWKNVVTERVDYDMTTKEGVYCKALNTIDYFDKASGKMIYSSDGLYCFVTEFETNLNLGKGCDHCRYYDLHDTEAIVNGDTDSSVFDNDVPISETIHYGDGEKAYDILVDTKEYNWGYSDNHRINDNHISNDERHTVDEYGYDVWGYRTDLTNLTISRSCLFPQQLITGCLREFDSWEIVGTETVLDRECVVVSGKLSGSYSEKLNVVSFVFYIDAETGVILKYIGYNNYGDISDFIIVESIAFDREADDVRSVDLSEYSDINIYPDFQ